MRTVFGLVSLLFLATGILFGQTLFSPDYQGEQSPQPLTEDSRINSVITGDIGTTTGNPPPSAFAGNPDMSIPASPQGHGDVIRGTNPPPAIGVADDGKIRDSNIVARIWAEQGSSNAKSPVSAKSPATQQPKR